jgi:hypothetical protein
MARISTYAIDTNVTSQDKWIGTDSNGSVTKNFTPEGVADWINSANADGGGGDNTAFSAITTFKLSKYNSGEVLIINFLNVLEDEYVLFCQTDNINNFGVYKITDITRDIDEADFYDITLTLVASNGNLVDEQYYSLISWPYNAGETNDKHYTHNQNNASVTWNVTHNLGKRPSVSVVLSTGQQGVADVQYIDDNSLTITLIAAESGKAYLN